MALSDKDKTDIRKYLGYGMRGQHASNLMLYVHQLYLLLEDRLVELTVTEEAVVKDYLTNLRDMEGEIRAARDTLQIDTAGSFKKNKSEIRDRINLFDRERNNLASYLNVEIRGSSRLMFRV